MKSESIELITKALIKFQTEVSGVAMESLNPFYKSKYADLITIIKTVKPVLVKNGLAFTQLVNKDETGGVITTMLMHESGQWIAANTNYPINGKPQEQGSAITYMRRYALSAILGIAADPDDDGEHAQNISVLDGALEEEMRSKKVETKSKPDSKAILASYEERFPQCTTLEQVLELIAEAAEDYKQLMSYEQAKMKGLVSKAKQEWNIPDDKRKPQ